MRLRRIALIAVPVLALVAGMPGMALADLVTNGGFETNGGNGLVGFNTTATGWSIDPSASSSYTFLFNPQSGTTSGTSADNSGAGGQYGNLSLWGPGNGSSNGLTLSPNGGAFIAQDSAFQQAAIQQTINGLTAGQNYAVSFYYAAAQQYGFTGATSDQWQVSLGGQTLNTPTLNIDSHGFSGWKSDTLVFTATSSSEVLSFFASGSPSGVPPFALLDGVSMNAVPEPSTIPLIALSLLGVAVLRRRRRARAAVA